MLRTPSRRWTLFLAVVVAAHHLGSVTGPLGTVGSTQWGDWLDLLVPWAVAGAAVLVLTSVPMSRRLWLAAGVALLAYVNGHGIHLAANSIATFEESDTAFLWDELVGHAIWYGGLWLLLGTLLVATRDELPRPDPLRVLLAGWLGVTLATNAIGGHAVPMALAALTVLGGLAWRRRTGTAVDVLVAVASAVVTLAGAWVAVGLLDVDLGTT